ncbi:hypothetical protein BAY59_25085 [Prauserella coralliicola]|nr:hypothetical protein BAY59_25085 [Prauserella coralliicola]
MVQAITARYVQEADDWAVTVAGLGKELNDRAPGIIAARDRADQLVEKLAPEGSTPTVVHLLNGSALEFTSAYMTARLARPEPGTEEPAKPESKDEASEPEPKDKPAEPKESSAKEDAAAKETKPRKRNVPRKELSKSPQPAEKETRPRAADGRYVRTTAAGLPGSAGSASAAG